MSWFKKVLNFFHEKEEHEVHELENALNNNNKGKELETRITYQYPKGRFRFPLQVEEEKKYTPTERQQSNYRDDRVSKKEKENKEVITSVSFEKPAKITKKNSRPFRPTEIPSPVYGFSKRSIPSDVVEFELNSEDSIIKFEQFSNYNKQDEINSLDEEKDNRYEEKNTQVEEIASHYEEIKTQVDEKDDQYEEMKTQVEEINDYYEEMKTNAEEIDDRYEEINTHDEEIDDRIEDITEPFEVMIEPNEIKPSIPFQNQAEEKMIRQEEVDRLPITEINLSENKIEPITEELDKKPGQRSHLPFNVLMLKQDKQKWEQKKIELVVQKESKPSTIEERVPTAEILKSTQIEDGYYFPGLELLNPPKIGYEEENMQWIETQERLLNEALKNFGVRAQVVNITQGPSVTRFEVQPEPGVKVNKITNLSDDIKLSLAAKDIRIEAPIPGKHTIGIEVPNKKSRPVLISEILKSQEFQMNSSPLTAVLGLDISGTPVVTDLKKMPHGLIAGATGSGKSVCINSILISLLFKASPQDLKLLLIDPKMVELAPYNHIPHLVSPVITDVKAATASLKWAVEEMERRYELFAHAGVRDISRFNEIAESHKRYSDKLPYIVIIIDELADLMMMSPADVEESICRIAQKARACGIHLIIATQRPSVDVITGLIKANVPTRAAFSVSSQIDSRTIIDISGAEKLLGRGDMLFLENGSSKPVRLQGTFVSDHEIDLVVEHVRSQQEPQYLFHQEELLIKAQVIEEEDELFYEACEFVIDQGGASTSSIQRRFKVGYNRAARLIEMMEKQGFISEPKGSKPRDILITEEELYAISHKS